jgi:hypothetical protein
VLGGKEKEDDVLSLAFSKEKEKRCRSWESNRDRGVFEPWYGARG